MRSPQFRSALLTLSLLAPALALSACVVKVNDGSGSDTAKPNSDGSEAAPDEAGEATESAGAGDKPERAEGTQLSLVECPTEAAEGTTNYCTEDGKLAAQATSADAMKLPDSGEVLFEQDGGDATRRNSLTITAVGDSLYIHHVTCGACRRVLGKAFMAHLGHMSAEQIGALQAELGLSADLPVLDSVDAWRSFASDERGSASLSELAKKAEGDV